MSPLLKIISLQWEGRDAYNFSISNCVVSLHADRNLSIISSLLLISPLHVKPPPPHKTRKNTAKNVNRWGRTHQYYIV